MRMPVKIDGTNGDAEKSVEERREGKRRERRTRHQKRIARLTQVYDPRSLRTLSNDPKLTRYPSRNL